MGNSAPMQTKIRTISIDQTSEWSKNRRNHDPPKRSVSSLNDIFRKTVGHRTSLPDKTFTVRVQLEESEKRLADTESSLQALKKEFSAVQLRNVELSGEVDWLREQTRGTRPDTIDSPRRCVNSLNSPQQKEMEAMRLQIRNLEHELKSSKLEQMRLTDLIDTSGHENTQKNYRITILEKEVKEKEMRIAALEEFVQTHLSRQNGTRPISEASDAVDIPVEVAQMVDCRKSVERSQRKCSLASQNSTFSANTISRRSVDDMADEIDQLLQSPVPVRKVGQLPRIESRRSLSGKSRDSGYLGDTSMISEITTEAI